MPQTILIVDDDEAQAQQLAKYIQHQYGFHTIVTSSARDALERLMLKLQPTPSAMITQSAMADMSGAQLVRKIRYADKQIPVIVMCPPLQEVMQECIQAGANDILIKPFSRPQLYLSIQNILRAANLDREVARLGRFHQNQMHLQDLVGKSPALQAMKKQAKQLIHSKQPIYIEGDKGAGKESLARVIHGSGELCGQAFIVFQPAIYLNTDESLKQLHQAFYAAQGGTLLIKHIDQHIIT